MFYKGKDSLNPSLMQHVVFHKDPGNRHHSKAYFVKLQIGVERNLTILGHLVRKEAEAIDDLLFLGKFALQIIGVASGPSAWADLYCSCN